MPSVTDRPDRNAERPARALPVRGSTLALMWAVFVAILAIFAANGVVYHRAARTIQHDESRVTHTHEVLGSIAGLLSTVEEAESSQRGYLLTDSESFLPPYQLTRERVAQQARSLRELVRDNPVQSPRAAEAERLAHARIDAMDEVVRVYRTGGEAAAAKSILVGRGKVIMDQLRAVLNDMDAEERRLLVVRAQAMENSHRRAALALNIALVSGVVLVSLVFLFLYRYLSAVVRQRDALASVTASEAKFQSIIDSAMDAIISVDDQERIVLFNKAAETIFGHNAADIIGKPLDLLIPERFRTVHHRHMKHFSDSGVTTRSMNSPGVLMALRSSGEEFPIEATISHVVVGGQHLFSVILRDITARKRTEEQLQQAQKMEAIGRLAGGVAHDFNNLLGIILGYAELLNRELHHADELNEWLQQIINSTNTGALLTKQLLAFSRKQTITPEYLDLVKVVEKMVPMLRRLLREDIELNVCLPEENCPVKVDSGHIQQLLLNLVANARDAIDANGKITIEVKNVELDASYAQHRHFVAPGPYVMMSVTDTGHGMPAEVAAKIFEPFFTTKSLGKGTGLGLATVYGIVKQNDGDIWVYSEPGMGTTFKIYLPRRAGVVELTKAAPATVDTLTGSETLLLVEDSFGLRMLTREILKRAGYHVLEAEDGIDALDVSAKYNGEIDLLLTDVVMPRLRGTELARRIAEKRPGIRVIVMSGYNEESIADATNGLAITVVEKPFTSEVLLQAIRAALDESEEELEGVG